MPFFGPLTCSCEPSTSTVVPEATFWKSVARRDMEISAPPEQLETRAFAAGRGGSRWPSPRSAWAVEPVSAAPPARARVAAPAAAMVREVVIMACS